ncbi:hypothetical protein C8J57DRAFT_1638009, partial [Mycena rebaudengoi]
LTEVHGGTFLFLFLNFSFHPSLPPSLLLHPSIYSFRCARTYPYCSPTPASRPFSTTSALCTMRSPFPSFSYPPLYASLLSETYPSRRHMYPFTSALRSCLLSLLSGRALRSLFSIHAPRPLLSVVLIPSSLLPNVSLLPGVHPSPFNYVYTQPFSLPSAPSLLHLVSHPLPQPPSRYTHSVGTSSTLLPSRLPAFPPSSPSPSQYKFSFPPPFLPASSLSVPSFFNT